jgi:thiamine-monophosphate kinase
MISEIDLIRRIRGQVLPGGPRVVRGIGDDCAVVAPTGDATVTLVTTDTLVQGVHFDLAWHPPELVGRKAVAVNVSDIAAMGGVPCYALLSLAAPATRESDLVERLLQGFMAALTDYQVTLIGGDTVRSDQGLVLSITLMGEVAREQVLYRSGAKPWDQVWVSGPLGQAAAGLEICRQGHSALSASCPELVQAHLDPQPEVALGLALAASGLVSAMIDLSDGLATDLAHLCEESGVGATVTAETLPISAATRQAADALGLDPMQLAIAGGEDYRLLFTAPLSATKRLRELARHAVGGEIFRIGEIGAGQGVLLRRQGEQGRLISFQGYDHFR